MGFRTYKATVTYLPAASAKRESRKFVFELISSQPLQKVDDLAFLKALAKLPPHSVIVSVDLEEQREPAAA